MVYKEVQQTRGRGNQEKAVPRACRREAVLSYDEKPGIQAVGSIAPDLAPVAGKYSRWSRDYKYKRDGTLLVLAGIDRYDGHVFGSVRDRCCSREFI